MTYEVFKVLAEQNMIKYLPERYQGTEVYISSVSDANGIKKDMLSVLKSENSLSPTLNLREFYEEFQGEEFQGREELFPVVMTKMADLYVKSDTVHGINLEEIKIQISARESLLAAVETKLENVGVRKPMLEEVPHTMGREGEWAFCYYVPLHLEDKFGMFTITNDMQNQSGVSTEELHMAAMENTQKNHPVTFESISDAVFLPLFPEGRELFSEIFPLSMYMVSNEQNRYGAAAFFYPGIQEEIAQKLGGDYVILPSSVHELLIIPGKEAEMVLDEFSRIVKAVNQQAKKLNELLADGAFYYDSEEMRVMTIEEKIELDRGRREAEQEQEPEQAEVQSANQIEAFMQKKAESERGNWFGRNQESGFEL